MAGVAAAALLAITILAIRTPAYGFIAAIALFGFEGSIKMRLGIDDAPSPLGLGAALIDLGLLIGLAGLWAADRGASLNALWAQTTKLERYLVFALGAWLALAVIQIPFSGDLINGLEGFRLVQFYVVAGIGGILLAARLRTSAWQRHSWSPSA